MTNGMIESLLGKVVKVERGGPESRKGQILAVRKDYFALLTEKDGIVFYQPHHVKSLSQNTKKEMQFKTDFFDDYKFIPPHNFACVLESLVNFKVKINRGGDIEGVLIEVDKDFVTVMNNDAIIRVAIFHIRNISLHPKKGKNDKQGSSGEKQNEKENSGNGRNSESGNRNGRDESRGRNGRNRGGDRGESSQRRGNRQGSRLFRRW